VRDLAIERDFEAALWGVASELGLDLDAATVARFVSHYALLIRWNRRVNLTRIDDPRDAAIRHFGESLFVAKETGVQAGTVLDVGSGAGFPGLPLAAWRQSCRVTLLEPVMKKAVFLREVSRDLPNVQVRQARLEAVSERYEWSVMRAVAPADVFDDLAKVSERVALLLGREGAKAALGDPRFEWDPPRSLPWGERRLLLIGRCRGC
jgi:16S rRNA (guanine527-N7)-methyltransferase